MTACRASPYSPDEQTTHHYVSVFARLRRQGTLLPTNDIWIAALVLKHDLVLLTDDAYFVNIPQMARA